MNKTGFINKLQEELKYDKEKCIIINSIIEDTSLIGKKNKAKMINGFMNELGVSESEAEHIYETAITIIKNSMKNKIRHPFKNQD